MLRISRQYTISWSVPQYESVVSHFCRVQSAYENHKDEIVWDGDRNSHVISTEDKLLSSQGAGEFVPTAAATFTSTGIQTESVVPPEAPVQAALSTTRGAFCEEQSLCILITEQDGEGENTLKHNQL